MANQANQSTNPRLMAFLIGLVGSSFAIVVVLVLLVPFTAFGLVNYRGAAIIVIGTALWSFSVSFLYGLLKNCEKVRRRLLKQLGIASAETLEPKAYKVYGDARQEGKTIEASPLGEDFIRVLGTPKIVRLTDGVTREMLAKLAAASLPAVSQRALDAAGVVTRDPSVEVNAGVVVAWLARNDFIEPIGNSRYEFTLLGKCLMESVSGTSGTPPPTTTVE